MLKAVFFLIINIQFLANAHISAYHAISGSENCQKIFHSFSTSTNNNVTKKIGEMYNFLYHEYEDLRDSDFPDYEIEIYMNWFCQVVGYLADFDKTKLIPFDGIAYGNKSWTYQYSPAFIKSIELHKKYFKEYQERKYKRKLELEVAYVEKIEDDIFAMRFLPRTVLIYNIMIMVRIVRYIYDYFYDPTIPPTHRLTNIDFLMGCAIFINLSIVNYMLY